MTEPIDTFCFVAAIKDLDVFHFLFAGFVSLLLLETWVTICVNPSIMLIEGAVDAPLNGVWIMVLVLGWLFSKKFCCCECPSGVFVVEPLLFF